MSGKSRGLGGFEFNREQAAQQLYRGTAEEETASSEQHNQPEQKASEHASMEASNSARLHAEMMEDEDVTTPTVDTPPAPPPAKTPEARVQFNNRIKPDRRRILDDYQRRYYTTMQAIVDQMVDEYLERRGLLPKDESKSTD